MATFVLTGNVGQLRGLARTVEGICAERGDNRVITITLNDSPGAGFVGSVTGPDGKERKH